MCFSIFLFLCQRIYANRIYYVVRAATSYAPLRPAIFRAHLHRHVIASDEKANVS